MLKSLSFAALVAASLATPAMARTVEAGPIWNQSDAKTKCSVLAASHQAKWTGQWWTTVQGQMSVCELNFD